jgi:hypothetical protein
MWEEISLCLLLRIHAMLIEKDAWPGIQSHRNPPQVYNILRDLGIILENNREERREESESIDASMDMDELGVGS